MPNAKARTEKWIAAMEDWQRAVLKVWRSSLPMKDKKRRIKELSVQNERVCKALGFF